MLNLLFGLNGRINRTKWWLVSGSIYACTQAYSLYLKSLAGPDGKFDKIAPEQIGTALTILMVGGLLMLAFMWVQFAVDVKRFHDRGKSFWWPLAMRAPLALIIFLVIGFVGSMATAAAHTGSSSPMALITGYGIAFLGCLLLAVVGAIWVLIECGFCSGDIDDNEYGPGDGMNIADDIMALTGGSVAVAQPSITSYRSAPAAASNMRSSTPRPLMQPSGKPVFGKRG